MRQCLLLTILVLTLPLSQLRAQGFGADGELWTKMDTTALGRLQKIVFLRGFYEGLLGGRARDIDRFPQDPSWDTLMAGLDSFYARFENRKIVVSWALQVLNLQMTGSPPTVVDSTAAYYRCRSSTLWKDLSASQLEARSRECAAMAKRRE